MQQSRTQSATGAFIVVTSLFFAWGFITSMIDPLIAAVKGIYNLGDREALLTQFAFFISYGVISLPAAALLTRAGHVRTILLSLAAMLAACLIILLATFVESYSVVLFGLFVLGSGITALQVAANPLSASIGDPSKSHFRLVFSQAFNSLGTVIGPYLGARVMLQGAAHKGGVVDAAARTEALGHIHSAFLIIAALMGLLILFIWSSRRRLEAAAPELTVSASPLGALRSGWALFGALAIFLYVGAEVSIGSLLSLFLSEKRVFDIPLQQAAELVSFYWMGAMIGRFAGSILLTRFKAAPLLSIAAAMAVLLCCIAFASVGPIAGYAAIAVGLFNSIMFPTIFTLTLERSSASHASTSGLLCVAIVGGAFLPQLYGHLADLEGRNFAYVVPALAYAAIVLFALAARKARVRSGDLEPPATIH
ncbi:MAG: glucose/galactose transporter [Alphaproteobacteria bacterium]|nr:glucose/galactose transporter [Alphaproteobacteria bacterium]